MKKLLIVFVLVLFFPLLLVQSVTARSYIVSIQKLQSVATGLRGYYKGEEIDFSDNWARLPENDSPAVFSLVITAEIETKFRGNNVHYFKLKENVPFSWFDLTLSLSSKKSSNNSSYSWKIEKRQKSEVPQRLPDNTLLIIAPSKYVKELIEEKSLQKDENYIRLPVVIFEAPENKKAVEEFQINAAMGLLNMRNSHIKKPQDRISEGRSIITAPSNRLS